MPEKRPARFLTISEVAEELATSEAQVIALVKRGDLPALKLGGRGQRRIERSTLEEFITRTYEATEREITERGAAFESANGMDDYAHDLDYRHEEGGEG